MPTRLGEASLSELSALHRGAETDTATTTVSTHGVDCSRQSVLVYSSSVGHRAMISRVSVTRTAVRQETRPIGLQSETVKHRPVIPRKRMIFKG